MEAFNPLGTLSLRAPSCALDGAEVLEYLYSAGIEQGFPG